MTTALYSLCACCGWLAAAYKLAASRRSTDPALTWVCLSFALLGVVFTAALPPVHDWLARHTGFADLSILLILLCVVAFSTTTQIMLLVWTRLEDQLHRRIRNRLIALGCVAVTMTALFLAAGTGARSITGVGSGMAGALYAACLLLYLVTLILGMLAIVRLGVRYARMTASPLVARGLRLAATGAALVLAYCVYRLADVVASWTGLGSWIGADVARPEPTPALVAAGGALLITLGLTLPSWGEQLVAVAEYGKRYLDYQRTHRLWRVVALQANPEVVLDRTAAHPLRRFSPAGLDFRAYRRIIELADARLALRPYAAATGVCVPGQAAVPAIAAAELRAAVGAKVEGVPAAGEHGPVAHTTQGTDVRAALRWWARVASAYRDRPVSDQAA
ncbi:MAB_1171c family putative transporter [Haloechinothrix sp. LS1_15]|uniref:MAB_1171c family putative transporter n=1 Tax=Haloechinothrix sp. LS1_15 TaxID=2652248 RepID=UPI0029450AEC|nr:MAB_1171c family putative transporter [Haloechinothrix sp. LS1_15]MDV6013395.1 hypothetical protein [Haloechinothrix sp. LS1_15]